MSASNAAAEKKLAKASAKKEARYVESLRTQILKKEFDVKSIAEALLLPPPAPKVKKTPKETLPNAWVREVLVKHTSEYDTYVAGLPETEKTAANGKPMPVMVFRKNFAKIFQTSHATEYDTFKTAWEAAHPVTPVEEESSAESSAESAAEESATESASPKKKKSSKASPAASTAPAPTPAPVLTVETPAPAKKGAKKSPAASAAASAAAEETPAPVVPKTGRTKVNKK